MPWPVPGKWQISNKYVLNVQCGQKFPINPECALMHLSTQYNPSEVETILIVSPEMSFAFSWMSYEWNDIHNSLVSGFFCSTIFFFFWDVSMLLWVFSSSFLFMTVYYFLVWLYHSFSILLLTDIWNISSLRILQMKILRAVCVYTYTFITLECLSRSRISGS